MKVYILIYDLGWDGKEIVGAYAHEEEAENARDEANARLTKKPYHVDEYDLIRMTRNDPIQSTHYDGCWKSGPKHYECAVRQHEELARLFEVQREVVLEQRACIKELMEVMGLSLMNSICADDTKYEDLYRRTIARAQRALDAKPNQTTGDQAC